MGELTESIVNSILGIEGPLVYLLVGLFAWAEAAFFLGFVTPGEIALVAGGVLASRGQVLLVGVCMAAAGGTVLGNTTGFWIGRVWGERVLAWGPLQRWFGPTIESARVAFQERGEWAIVGGRLTSFLRIIVPFVAGVSGMRYRRFLAFDVPTGVVWAIAWVCIGFGLGESWRVLFSTAGQAAFLVLGLFVAALVIGWLAVRIGRNQPWVVNGVRRLVTARSTVWVLRRIRRPMHWVGRRFSPRLAGGLQLTLGFVVLVASVGAAGLVFGQTRAMEGLALIDFPVLEWIGETRTPEALAVSGSLVTVFRFPWMGAIAALLLGLGWWRGGWMAGVRAGFGLAGAGVGAWLLDIHVLEGLVPRAEFPSVATAVAGALLIHVVAVVGKGQPWKAGVLAGAVGVFLLLAVGLAALVAGTAAPSGLALGAALGVAWAAILEVPPRIPWSVRQEIEREDG